MSKPRADQNAEQSEGLRAHDASFRMRPAQTLLQGHPLQPRGAGSGDARWREGIAIFHFGYQTHARQSEQGGYENDGSNPVARTRRSANKRRIGHSP